MIRPYHSPNNHSSDNSNGDIHKAVPSDGEARLAFIQVQVGKEQDRWECDTAISVVQSVESLVWWQTYHTIPIGGYLVNSIK